LPCTSTSPTPRPTTCTGCCTPHAPCPRWNPSSTRCASRSRASNHLSSHPCPRTNPWSPCHDHARACFSHRRLDPFHHRRSGRAGRALQPPRGWVGMLGRLGPRRALLGLILALPGCVVVDGPCQLRVERSASSASSSVQCEAGGSATLLVPAHTVESIRGDPETPEGPAGPPHSPVPPGGGCSSPLGLPGPLPERPGDAHAADDGRLQCDQDVSQRVGHPL